MEKNGKEINKRKNETKVILIQETARKAIRHVIRIWSLRNLAMCIPGKKTNVNRRFDLQRLMKTKIKEKLE